MRQIKKLIVQFIKTLDLGSAVAVRLTKVTGKSKVPIHPKHFLTQNPWYTRYLNKKDVVLDLGSGNGQSAIKAARLSKKVIGLELDDNLINIANLSARIANVKNVQFIKSDLEEKLNFKDNDFDKVIFLDVLEHLKNRDRIFNEIKRILKPKGLMFLGVPNSQTSWKKFQRSAGVNSFSDPDHKTEFSENSIRGLLKNHSFKILNFGYGKFDIPARGIIDILGAISLTFYKKISDWRQRKVKDNLQEAAGFEIVAQK